MSFFSIPARALNCMHCRNSNRNTSAAGFYLLDLWRTFLAMSIFFPPLNQRMIWLTCTFSCKWNVIHKCMHVWGHIRRSVTKYSVLQGCKQINPCFRFIETSDVYWGWGVLVCNDLMKVMKVVPYFCAVWLFSGWIHWNVLMVIEIRVSFCLLQVS